MLQGMFSANFASAERYNLVVNSPDVRLVSISTGGRAVVVVVPEDFYVTQVAHGYGQYRVSKIYSVGELDHRGGKVLKDSVAGLLGVPVDSFVQSPRPFKDLRSFFVDWQFIFSDKSDIGIWDRVRLVHAIMFMRFDKIETIDLSNHTNEITLADKTKAEFLSSSEIDYFLNDLFAERIIEQENLRVSVVNSTDVSGLGSMAGRILENIGLLVISVESRQAPVSQCIINSSEKLENSLTVKRIAKIFDCRTDVSQGNGRSDVEVVIGTDYANIYGK
jgi:hypothetical protein